MKRLRGNWIGHGVQLGLLAGLGLAVLGTTQAPVQAGGGCPQEGECSFKKPNFMIILDYSSSMNEVFDVMNNTTRWDAAVAAVQDLMTTDNSFFSENMHIALMRYGHDPDPNNPDTAIPNDTSGISDGQSIDVHWYDPAAQDKSYFECNGQAVIDSLNATPDPLCIGMNCAGIGTWTNGALQLAQATIDQSRIDHPQDVVAGEERFYANLLMTDGLWTSPDGLTEAGPANQNPADTADAMWTGYPAGQEVPTYVVALGDAMGQMFTDEIAAAGGTGTAIDAADPMQLIDALKTVVEDIKNSIIIPECTGGLPRIMVILDASSSMLNVNGVAGPFPDTGWDQARLALAGSMSIFDVEVGTVMQPVEDLVHLGLLVFGGDFPAEEKILVDYGPCMKDNFAWALDPNTSCGVGCTDPWGGPPITWTFLDSPPAIGYDGTPFDQPTSSHMPSCQVGGNPGMCTGSGTYTHRGLQLAATNQTAYAANPPPEYPVDANTVFANILITDGNYTGYSTDQQVRDELVAMYNANITTYVIGLGSGPDQTLLDRMACWGSGGDGVPNCAGGNVAAFSAATQQDLEDALKTIIEGLNFDPCCAFNDCSLYPEPTTGEPDDMPTTGAPNTTGPITTSGGTSTSGGTTTATTGGTSAGTSASGGSTSGATATATATATSGGTGATATATATSGGTGGSASASATDSVGSSSSASASDSGSGGSNSGSDSGTDSDATATVTASGTDSGIGTDTFTTGDTAGALDDDGCACTTNPGNGPLGWLFGLGLLGLRRRRR